MEPAKWEITSKQDCSATDGTIVLRVRFNYGVAKTFDEDGNEVGFTYTKCADETVAIPINYEAAKVADYLNLMWDKKYALSDYLESNINKLMQL